MKKRLALVLALIFYVSVLPPLSTADLIKGNFSDIVTTGPWVDVRAFMDGQSGRPTLATWNAAQTTTELSEVFAAAITWLPSAGGNILVPTGSFLITSTVRITKRGVNIWGQGPYSSEVIFTPTVDNTIAFDFRMNPDTSVLADCGLHGLRITSAPTAVSGKVAIRLYDVSKCYFSNLLIYNNATDNTAEGIRTMGRELTTFDRVTVFADSPLHIMAQVNGGASAADADYFKFIDCNFAATNQAQTLATPNPVVTVDNDVIMQRCAFENNNWSHGKHGFYWAGGASGTGGNSSVYLTFRNVYREQNTDANGWGYYIDHYVQNVTWENANSGSVGNGIYLRSVYQPTLINFFHPVGSSIGFDIDNTVRHFSTINSYFAQTQTFNTPGMTMFHGYGSTGSNYQNQFWDQTGNYVKVENGVYSMKYRFYPIADNGTFNIPFFDINPVTATITVAAVNGSGTHFGGTVMYNATTLSLIDNTAKFKITTTGGDNTFLNVDRVSAYVINLVNKTGGSVWGYVSVEGIQ